MQTESDVGTEMIEIGSHRGIRSLLLIIIRKGLDAILDIIGYILLFLSVPSALPERSVRHGNHNRRRRFPEGIGKFNPNINKQAY